MSLQLQIIRDSGGVPTYAMEFPDDIKKINLSANVEKTFIVPANYSLWWLMFSIEPGTSVFISKNQTATVATGTFSSTGGEGNPGARTARKGDVIHFITPDTNAWITVSLYWLS